jgi:TRAP-type mannitol/chloroaromatic compound transport system substrate-binding protein
MIRRRREVLLRGTAAAIVAGNLPASAIAQGIRELKMVTSWPKGSLGLQTSAERLAQSITTLSDGRLKIARATVSSALSRFLMRSARV